jgi:hypothetical protein
MRRVQTGRVGAECAPVQDLTADMWRYERLANAGTHLAVNQRVKVGDLAVAAEVVRQRCHRAVASANAMQCNGKWFVDSISNFCNALYAGTRGVEMYPAAHAMRITD